MPRVKIDYVVSFSSEDPDHPSANLLQDSASGKRWLAAAGSGTASVVLQLARAVRISSLSLGAHRAALVEVLVGRSETPQYEVLVPRCILQTPADARRGTNPDRVRSFAADQMSEGIREKAWDRLRVVCSQPYDKHCKFGLSFVHVFEPEESQPGGRPAQLSAICTPLRRVSSDDETFRPGALFAAHLQSSAGADPQTSGQQIRQATSRVFKHIPDTSSQLVKTSLSAEKARHRDSDRNERSNTSRNDQKCEKDKLKHKDMNADSRNERNSNFDNASSGRKNTETETKRNREANASEEHSSSKKKRDTDQNRDNQKRDIDHKRDTDQKRDKDQNRDVDQKRDIDHKKDLDKKRDKDQNTQRSPRREQKEGREISREDNSRIDEEHDTDDEIEKFLLKQKLRDPAGGKAKELETPAKKDAEQKTMETDLKPEANALPAFLDGLTFAIDPSAVAVGFDDRLITRYVFAYGGEVVEDATSANYLLCGAPPPRPAAAPLRPDWLWRCHKRGRRVRLQPYLLT